LKKDLPAIKTLLRGEYGDKPGAKQDINQVINLLDAPSKHVWITFEDDYL
jgi:hypothetical protein